MVQLTDFTGTWRAENGAPFSSHTFTWALRDGHLVGRWIVEVPDAATARAATAAGRPTWAEMQIGEPWLEDGALLFHVNGGPFILLARGDAPFVCTSATNGRSSEEMTLWRNEQNRDCQRN